VSRKRNLAKAAKELEVGSAEWHAEERRKARFAAGVMKDLATSASQGSKWAAKSLEEWAAKYPDVARSLSQLGDLCEVAEEAWVKAVAGESPVDQVSVRDEIAGMKAELLPEKASILERVLASSLITAYLAHQRAVTWAARPAPQEGVAAARDRRVESTSKRLLVAIKTLSLVRQQQVRGLEPRVKLKVFEAGA
jgi:hypothetical protein